MNLENVIRELADEYELPVEKVMLVVQTVYLVNPDYSIWAYRMILDKLFPE